MQFYRFLPLILSIISTATKMEHSEDYLDLHSVDMSGTRESIT